MDRRFNRLELLTGTDGLDRLKNTKVIIFGLGGVGSWTAEALARSAVGSITLVDADDVAISNINRQLPALDSTVGEPKVDVLAHRISLINPDCKIMVRKERYSADNADTFPLDSYDYIIDAIDSLADKQLLILKATSCSKAQLFSSMGAALKMDPSRIHVAEFWKVTGDPLAAALRRKFRKSGLMPRRKFKCVYSDELLTNHNINSSDVSDGSMTFGKVATNGAVCHITSIFGMTLASLVMRSVLSD